MYRNNDQLCSTNSHNFLALTTSSGLLALYFGFKAYDKDKWILKISILQVGQVLEKGLIS